MFGTTTLVVFWFLGASFNRISFFFSVKIIFHSTNSSFSNEIIKLLFTTLCSMTKPVLFLTGCTNANKGTNLPQLRSIWFANHINASASSALFCVIQFESCADFFLLVHHWIAFYKLAFWTLLPYQCQISQFLIFEIVVCSHPVPLFICMRKRDYVNDICTSLWTIGIKKRVEKVQLGARAVQTRLNGQGMPL